MRRKARQRNEQINRWCLRLSCFSFVYSMRVRCARGVFHPLDAICGSMFVRHCGDKPGPDLVNCMSFFCDIVCCRSLCVANVLRILISGSARGRRLAISRWPCRRATLVDRPTRIARAPPRAKAMARTSSGSAERAVQRATNAATSQSFFVLDSAKKPERAHVQATSPRRTAFADWEHRIRPPENSIALVVGEGPG